MERQELQTEYVKALRHLGKNDPVLKKLISRVGPCTLEVRRNYFALLVRAIVSQQISSLAARAISARLLALLKPEPLTPQSILRRSDEDLAGVGLSGAKTRYIRDLAEKIMAGAVPIRRLSRMPDDEVIEALTQVKGIGVWTAQMFLIFALGRLDVLPVDDFGLRAGVQQEYLLKELPRKKELSELAAPWEPYRSIATWYFWRSRGPVPQSS
jgi:DNA-3-methyladenine glycosylase II